MCRLVMGNKSTALAEISQACQLCSQQPKLLQGHRPQLHALIGLYAMSMNCMEAAEAQFLAALRVSSVINLEKKFYFRNRFYHDLYCFVCLFFFQTTERELQTFANLNLAIVYLRTKRDQELGALLERINPESLPSHSHSLRAAAYYVQGLQAFFGARYNEAKYVFILFLLCIISILYF